MQYSRRFIAEERQRAYNARSQKAGGSVRMDFWLMGAPLLTAFWQDRNLAPPVHDGMRVVKSNVEYVIENSDEVRAYVRQAFSSPTGTSAQPKYDPITSWLLKWKDA